VAEGLVLREDRRKSRLVREAGFPRPKRLDDFDFTANPLVDPGLIHTLAKGAWIRAGQLCTQQLRHLPDEFTGDVEHGTIGDHVGSSVWSILW
jgi:hypothetical protein